MGAPNSIPRRRMDTRVRKFRGKFLVAGRDREAFELSETAEFIFRRIDGKRTVQEIGSMVAEEFGAPLEMAIDDCAELISELVEGRVIDVIPAGEDHEQDQ